MRSVATWLVAIVVGLAALVGLIAFINSRDDSGVQQQTPATGGPGRPYRGEPVLSPALEEAVKRGNVIVLYRDTTPPPGTDELVPPGGKALEQAGQSVVVEREPTLEAPLAAVSAKRIEQADTPQQLEPFIDYWLGGR
jgi:hypothetical protein